MSTAPVTVAMPRLPSMAEIEKTMRERLPGLKFYNPSSEWIQLDVFGLTHLWACPDLGGAIEAHPITNQPIVCDGCTEVRGRFIDQKDSSGKKIEGQDAPAMMKFLIGPEKYGQMGCVWLPGATKEEDDKLRDLSRRVYGSYQHKRDEDIVSRRAEFKANWLKSPSHKGEPCPPPTAVETAAMDRLQTQRRAAAWKYECDVEACPGYAVNEWERFETHMRLAHSLIVKKVDYEKEIGGLSKKVRKVAEGEEDAPPVSEGIEAAAAKFAERMAGTGAEVEVKAAVASQPVQPVQPAAATPEDAEDSEDMADEERPQPRSHARKRTR